MYPIRPRALLFLILLPKFLEPRNNVHKRSFTITSKIGNEYLIVESAGHVDDTADLFRHSELVYAELMKYDFKKVLVNDI